jgi:hypothetical protein
MSDSFSLAASSLANVLDTASVQYAIIGSFAMRMHGVSRTPKDIDVIIDYHKLAAAHDAFSADT